MTCLLAIIPKDNLPQMITSPKEHHSEAFGSSIMLWCGFSSPGNGALIRAEGIMNFTLQHYNNQKHTSKSIKEWLN